MTAAEPKPESAFAAKIDPRVRLQEDGSMLPAKAEQMVLAEADGIDRMEAWKVLSGTTRQDSVAYQRKIVYHPLYKDRLEMLKAEKQKLEAVDIFGEAEWAAKQLWRLGRCTNDPKMTMKGADMLLDIAKLRQPKAAPAAPPADAPEGSTPEPAPVGKPVTKLGVNRDRATLTARLVAHGVAKPVPASDAEED